MGKVFMRFDNQERTVKDTIDDFISMKMGKKTDETVKYYEQRLNSFNLYLTEQEQILKLCDVTITVIDRYMNYKRKGNPRISNQTLNNNLRAIRTFINYCINEGYITHFHIDLYPSTNIPKKPYTEDEPKSLIWVNALLQSIGTGLLYVIFLQVEIVLRR